MWPGRFETLAYGRGMLPNVRENPARLLLLFPYLVSLGIRLRELAGEYDLVNVHFLIPQGLAARIFGVRAVVSIHGSDVSLGRAGLGRLLLGFALSQARAVTANSRATARRVEGLVPKMNTDGADAGWVEARPPKAKRSSSSPLDIS